MPPFQFTPKQLATLKSPQCHYYGWGSWQGDADILKELHPHLSEECDVNPKGFVFNEATDFNGYYWTRLTSENWHIPIIACCVYVAMLLFLKPAMAKREKMYLQPVVLVWNFGLSAFSLAGVYYCVPQLLWGDHGVVTEGWYTSVCSHAVAYGHKETGFFVCLFIYSKIAELFDTLWLVLRKSPVILLHWYHHVTVLLYCWHSYSVRIGTGLWFASMNYTVHSIMYAYYGLTQMGPTGRKLAKKVAMFITTLQLTQMVVGIAVTVASVVYHYKGETCHVSLVNSALGLVMYSSYFVLFLQLFLNHYVFGKKGGASTAANAANKAKPANAPPSPAASYSKKKGT